MASFEHAFLAAAAMVLVWTWIGVPVAVRLFAGAGALLLAPALGFAIHVVVALPAFRLIGMGRGAVVAVTAACVVGAVLAMRGQKGAVRWPPVSLAVAVVLAALLACVPAASVLPKATSEGVTLSASIFDHSKIAMIDGMARSGVPPLNPFVHEAGTPDRLAYYYLWHFGAAVFAVLTGASGWEADAALTWFTGFASLLLMIGLALRLGAGRAAPFLVLVLAASASVRSLLDALPFASVLKAASGLGGWLFQTAWAPQHLASASCVVLACLALVRLAEGGGWLAALLFGLLAAAGYQTSIWVGGVTFAVAAFAIALFLLLSLEPQRRAGFAVTVGAAGALALLLSLPFLLDQASVAAARGGGFPLALSAVEVLGAPVTATLRAWLDVPAYWLVYLPVEFASFYVAGSIGLWMFVKERRAAAMPLALLVAASLAVAGLLRSTVAWNNDLGWRAVLPALLLLVPIAAAAISRGSTVSSRIAGVFAAAGVILALPYTLELAREDLFASPTPSERAFADAPALWQAVQRHASMDERVANNPAFLADATPWPVNISWALLGNRLSCYGGDDLAIAFAAAPAPSRAATRDLFDRVFAGMAKPGDVRALAERYGCDVIVLVPQDGAWARDPFTSGDVYRPVEAQDGWRIYRRVQRPANQLKPRSSQ
ncbi:hypothetical protein [Reyranella sp.]|uniref:hypothetical protein n=1 Tax=Reyranella sp. TaxID=1929291 RepID=UPI003BA891E8